MQSRMDRYNASSNNENTVTSKFEVKEGSSRQARNKNLYENFGDTELDNFDVDSNVSIIGDSSKSINLDNLRDMLDRKYREPEPKKKEEVNEEEVVKMNLAETREYDLNQILEQARANKETTYEEERLMKLHNTQYDILKNLNIYGNDANEEDEEIDEVEVSRPRNANEQRLLDLIDTINENEFRNTQELALDILSDLTGDDDNTKVLGAMDLTSQIEANRAAAREEHMNTTQILNEARKTIGDMEDEYEKTQDLTEELSSTTQILEQAGQLIDEMQDNTENLQYTGSTTEILMQAGEVINEIGNSPIRSIDESSTTEILQQAGDLINDMELPKTQEIEIGNTTAILSEAGQLIEAMEKEEVEEPKVIKKHEIDDDFADIKEDSLFINFLLKVIIVIIIILFIAGGVYLANRFLGLGLF